MSNTPSNKNIQAQVSNTNLPSPLLNLITDYVEDDIMLERLNNLKFNDVCYRDCQGHNCDNYSNPLCRDCKAIEDLEKALKALLNTQGKQLYFHYGYIITDKKR